MTQDLLDQLNEWHETDEFQKIVDTIRAIPEEEWDFDLIMHLGRALNNVGDMEGAIKQLLTIQEQGQDTALWNFRMGYAYYYLDQEEKALPYFEKAHVLDPADEDAVEFIQWCKQYMQQRKDRAKRASDLRFSPM